MYSKFVVLCWAAACVVAAPAPAPTDVVPLEKQQPTVIPIVSQSDELESNGTYKFSYETGNGIKREETSYDKVVPKAEGRSAADSNEGGESDESNEIHVQQGSYSYTAPDGTVISVRYIADENGFQPIGDHIPRVPGLSGGSSSEKSGRALKTDSVAAATSSSAAAPPTKQEAEKSAPEVAQRISADSSESKTSTTEAAQSSEGSGESSEKSSEAPQSTTVAATTANASSEVTNASTTAAEDATTKAAEATTNAAEATTKAAEVTTKAAEPTSTEPASTSADASTEASSTTASA